MAESKRAEETPWWKRNVAALVTWGLLALGFFGTYSLKVAEVQTNTGWRIAHVSEYQEAVRRVDDVQHRVEVLEKIVAEGRTTDRETIDVLNRLDKQIAAVLPQIQALADQMKEFARKLDERR